MSSDFFSKVQDLAVKTRIITRREQAELDDSWLYEEKSAEEIQSEAINYYDNSASRDAYSNPKRETRRSFKTNKRTFGYQLPLKEATEVPEVFEREVKRAANATYRRNRAPRAKTFTVYYDIVK